MATGKKWHHEFLAKHTEANKRSARLQW